MGAYILLNLIDMQIEVINTGDLVYNLIVIMIMFILTI